MEILAKLFGSTTKVKLMRYFLFNQDSVSSMAEIVLRVRSPQKDVRKEINILMGVGLLKKKHLVKDLIVKKGKRTSSKKVQEEGYSLDQKFPYLQAMKNLLITVSLHADDSLVRKFSTAGRIKLFIVSGVFIQEWDTRVDLLIVGDDLNFNKIELIIKAIESEVGKDITYSAFETADFEYRYGMHDRLIRDIIDFPHVLLVDKLQIFEK